MNLKQVPLNKLHLWENNPRGIKKQDFQRLKEQISNLNSFKPLIAVEEDGEYTILGGNMRLKAYEDLGHKDTWISIVEAPDDKTKLRYALADNDRAGYYEQERLAELALELPEVDLDLYHVDIGKTKPVRDIVDNYGPSDPVIKYNVVVECEDEDDRTEVLGKLKAIGLKCRV